MTFLVKKMLSSCMTIDCKRNGPATASAAPYVNVCSKRFAQRAGP